MERKSGGSAAPENRFAGRKPAITEANPELTAKLATQESLLHSFKRPTLDAPRIPVIRDTQPVEVPEASRTSVDHTIETEVKRTHERTVNTIEAKEAETSGEIKIPLSPQYQALLTFVEERLGKERCRNLLTKAAISIIDKLAEELENSQ